MGNCISSFRGQFTPNGNSYYVNGTTDIVMKPVDDTVDKCVDVAVQPVVKSNENLNEPVNGDAINDSISEGTDENSEEQALIVEFLDVCINENTKAHHTNCFQACKKEIKKLVIRRGQAFTLNLILNRSYKFDDDILCLVFTKKHAPKSIFDVTEITLPVVPPAEMTHGDNEWYIAEVLSDDNSVRIQVVPSANAIVGEWQLEVDSRNKHDLEAPYFHYKVEQPICILFNPWCKDDAVYLEDEKHREEYVLCDSGLIWRGCHSRLRTCIWNYAQFEDNILECSLYILTHVGRLSIVKCSDPVRIVRHLSAALNSRDDNGVIVGNWTGCYKGGECPVYWSNSRAILQKYYKTKKPVKYGQCWVFSGVFTTVCRALGIPSRPVTNFSSAHDTNNSLTVDCYFNGEGKPVENMNIDSVWNFHVWTEVWMQRPDLEPGNYGGWQAVDSTPQEESDGTYQCGPASVAAIKRGEIMKAFDTQFLYAEVNADKVYWKYNGPKQPLKLTRNLTEEIGMHISTKAVGKFERQDITDQYKHSEGTPEERHIMLQALKQRKNALSRYYMNEEFEDVKFDFLLLEDVIIGQPFSVTLKATNKRGDGKQYNISVSLKVEATNYTNSSRKLVKKDDFETNVDSGAEQNMTMNVDYSDYHKVLSDQCDFLVTATAHVSETNFDYCAQDDFRVRMPDINIEVEGEVHQNALTTINAFFTNPLPKVLNNGYFILEGPDLNAPVKVKCKGKVKAGADARITCKLTPLSWGPKVIAAKFYSKELNDVDGYKSIFIKPQRECDTKDHNSHL